MLISSEVIRSSDVKFGTSGARGLVSQFSSNLCAAFTHAFVACMRSQFKFDCIAIGIDNRPSSPDIAESCIQALSQLNIEAIYYGVVPTPALAYVSMQDNIPCIMVTGSHIPFDRNGLKFYRPDGEISKLDEHDILSINARFESINIPINGSSLKVSSYASNAYINRYTDLFSTSLLSGKKIGIYEHSSAGRDLYANLFTKLGAEVISLERSEQFVPIDTEAVSETDKLKAIIWSREYNLDAIFSTDGDGDRPLVADEDGVWLRGDILGILCSKVLHVEALAVPVNCNTLIEVINSFKHVERTKIGSPYVISTFSQLATHYSTFAGFEANGGYILGSDILINGHLLKALPTRDALLPALMLFSLSKDKNKTISKIVNELPNRFTHSDRIQNFSSEKSYQLINCFKLNPSLLLVELGLENIAVRDVNFIDGLRVTLENEDVIHLRPSGNAPEIRCYAESTSIGKAENLVLLTLRFIDSLRMKGL
ncbi:phosphomannomutase [Shewanella sp. SG44-2]|uniref:phosphomannomutase n=1 Tax=Shewanella sp. SG44-2 TaxID=2760962 RepID=UPI001603DB38|nr:phosphomannomutase [Shewanella sp. SG44-2]MBB1428481.1 phosphomannomutase [Shewanella sp. SG44-2]